MSKRRNKYPSVMQYVGQTRPPNHLCVVLEPFPHTLPAVKRECGYCNEERSRRKLVKLPNGLFVCDDHPSGPERDKIDEI